MKVALLHIADIHLRGQTEPIQERVELLARAIAAASMDAAACVVVCTGDVAFSGSENEYLYAHILFDDLRKHVLGLRPGIEYFELFVPGNHDCAFPADPRSRQALIDVLINDLSDPKPGDSVVSDCLTAQRAFFEFRDARAHSVGKLIPKGCNLRYVYRLTVGCSTISFDCLNTAFLSQITERQGQLLAPTWIASPDDARADAAVILYHHPHSWLRADNSRRLREMAESESDLILTGHEHEPDQYSKHTTRGEDVTYFDGHVLNESKDPATSGFRVILVDLDAKVYRTQEYSWDGELFAMKADTDWMTLIRNVARGRNLTFTAEFSDQLDDCGIALTHPRRSLIRLDELYVYPDMQEDTFSEKPGSTTPRYIKNNQVELYFRTHNHVIITGDERSGRTTLVKMLIKAAKRNGQYPILLAGELLKQSSLSDFEKIVRRAAVSQYGQLNADAYMQLAAADRILVIDDLEKSKLNLAGINRLAEIAKDWFGQVVLSLGSYFTIMEASSPSADQLVLLAFRRISIDSFGYARRGELIEKWIRLGQEYDHDELAVSKRIAGMEQLISTLIGRNLLPASPLFVLTLLQLSEGGVPHNNTLGSYGFHYETLISQSLQKAFQSIGGRTGLDVYSTALEWVAYRMLQEKRRFLTESELTEVLEGYRISHSVALSQEQAMRLYEAANVLRQDREGRFIFHYRYTYYYFVARYIQGGIYTDKNGPTLRALAQDMANKVYVEDYANIIMFLIYLTRDEQVIRDIINKAKSLFPTASICDFDRDCAFTNRLDDGPLHLELPEGDAGSGRRTYREALDDAHKLVRTGAHHDDLYMVEDVVIDTLIHVNEVLKLVQIMGQIVCNSPGAISGDLKLEVVGECYRLGLRMYSSIIKPLEDELENARKCFGEMVREIRGIEDPALVSKESNAFIRRLVFVGAFGVVKRLALASGSEHLAATYRSLPELDNDAAFDLIDLSIRLDCFRQFPESRIRELKERFKNKPFALAIMTSLVTEHFYLYPVNHDLRQRVGAWLEIKTNEPRMLAGGHKQLPS